MRGADGAQMCRQNGLSMSFPSAAHIHIHDNNARNITFVESRKRREARGAHVSCGPFSPSPPASLGHVADVLSVEADRVRVALHRHALVLAVEA
ncbi:hypothetical protein MVI01_38770 [Myxococcus virescens]|uniref:Uncharacterized protein n=1 Tax=Myxococcus virescens TaxID=83456 RepID=A0A511HEW6_9BACT|nr:hypothetical protein MVI01_38770 [Myxococcus virescens]